MEDLFSTVYKALILASIVSFIIASVTDSNASFGAYITAYSVLILGILLLLTGQMTGLLKNSQGSTAQSVWAILSALGPFLLMLFVAASMLYYLIIYKDIIVENHVSNSYFTFSGILTMLLMLQTYLIYSNMNTETGKIPKLYNSMLYLIGVIALICSIIIQIILKYYTTDGFSTLSTF